MGWEPLLLAAVGGLLVGFLLTLFGGGGSVLATPWLVYVVGLVDTHAAIGTSAAAVAVNAATGLAAQARAGRVKWPCAIVFAISGLTGALVGAHLAKQVDGKSLMMWFAFAMIAIAVSMLLPKRSEGDPGVHLKPAMVLKLAPVGLVTGLAAGFFGIGGGFLIAPGLMASTGMTMANAGASSLVSVTLFGTATSASYAASGMVVWPLFGALVLGGAAGTLAAMPVARRLESRAALARSAFAVLVIAVALYILIK